MKGDPKHLGFSTRAIHAGQPPDPTTGSVTVPIYATSTYVHDELGRHKGFEYARVQNPTRTAFEQNIAALEGGLAAHAFASGMSAIACLMTLLKAGDHAVVSHTTYGGTYRYLSRVLERYDLRFSWVDTSDLAAVEHAFTPATRMLYVETPTNPLMDVTDLAAAAELAHARGAVLAVDNTFLSPYLQRPIDLGADFVVHSGTKFLNGHSDSLGGVLVSTRAEDAEWFALVQKSAGAVLSPFDAFLHLRGVKTLAVRMDRHQANARAVADFLVQHGRVRRVLYPGLPDHPGHAVQKRQARGFGSILTIDLGGYEAAKAMLDRLRVWSLAESLGGVESLASHPASMTHASIPEERRAELGLTDGLVRLSVGIEDVEDLLADLDQALAGVPTARLATAAR
ncbi:MAG TPA: PLP-dependent aspartate aminotransferase family protein [Thermoanaerobaculia bacterium]|nr:PLP-dependent aspartate aminotransferase family protein [Thermoanaerobaculia bacterium]